MTPQGRFGRRSLIGRTAATGASLLLGVLLTEGTCRRSAPSQRGTSVLRIGFGGLTAGSSLSGLRPFIQNLSNEALAAMGNNGRPEPRIANRWDVSGDGLRLTVRVRPNVRFHDGTPVTAPLVVEALKQTLPVFMGAAYGDVSAIDAVSNDTILFSLRRAS